MPGAHGHGAIACHGAMGTWPWILWGHPRFHPKLVVFDEETQCLRGAPQSWGTRWWHGSESVLAFRIQGCLGREFGRANRVLNSTMDVYFFCARFSPDWDILAANVGWFSNTRSCHAFLTNITFIQIICMIMIYAPYNLKNTKLFLHTQKHRSVMHFDTALWCETNLSTCYKHLSVKALLEIWLFKKRCAFRSQNGRTTSVS